MSPKGTDILHSVVPRRGRAIIALVTVLACVTLCSLAVELLAGRWGPMPVAMMRIDGEATGTGALPLPRQSSARIDDEEQANSDIQTPDASPMAALDSSECESSSTTGFVAAPPPHDQPAVNSPTPMRTQASPTFNNRAIRKARVYRMVVTGYSPDERSCGASADGITASGYSVWTNGMRLVAADTKLLPFGSLVAIPGYNGDRPVPVLDRGGKIKGYRLDLLFPTHEQAMVWGKKTLDVTVWEYAN